MIKGKRKDASFLNRIENIFVSTPKNKIIYIVINAEKINNPESRCLIKNKNGLSTIKSIRTGEALFIVITTDVAAAASVPDSSTLRNVL